MDGHSAALCRRLLLAARTPGLDAAALAALEAESADFAVLERPDAALLARCGLTTAGIAWLLLPDEARIQADLRWLDQAGCALLPCTAPDYPPMLRASAGAPPLLFVRGRIAALREPQL